MRILVVVLVLALGVSAQFDRCTQAGRDAAAMLFCSECEVINGRNVPTRPLATPNQMCVSPCLDQEVGTTTIEIPPVSTTPCVYYEVLNTPHEEVILAKCANVQDDTACDLLGGIFEHQTGTPGEVCDPFPALGQVLEGSPCCPDGTLPGIVHGLPVCASNDTSYAGPTLEITLPVCTLGTCRARNASVVPGAGVVYPEPSTTASCTPSCTATCTAIDATTCTADCSASCVAACATDPEASCVATCEATCSASCTPAAGPSCTAMCTPFCTAEAQGSFNWDVCPGCAQVADGDPCPSDCSGPDCFAFTAPPPPPTLVSIANITVIPGMCAGGVCVGNLNASLVGLNTQGESCAAGACQPRLVDADIDLTDPGLYPTPTCHPACPGYPSCPTPCPGWPNLADGLSLLEPLVAQADLADGEECRVADSCVSGAVCVSGQCLPTIDRGPVCERFTCRQCDPFAGTCFGPPSPAGTPCRVGCVGDETGTCDGAGNCIGPPIGDDFCRNRTTDFFPPDDIDEPCFDIPCIVRDLIFNNPMTAPGSIVSLRIGGLPLQQPFVTDELIASELDRVVPALTGSFSICDVVPTFATCDDNDACTRGDVCNAELFCVPVTETRSGCIASQCRECNATTGLCDVPVATPQPCFTACGDSAQGLVGSCNIATGTCDPFFPDPDVCALPPSISACNIQVCNSIYSGGLIPIPVDELVPETSVAPSLSTSCSLTPRPDGSVCQTIDGQVDQCITLEQCNSGVCTIVSEVDCTGIFDANPCVDSGSATCDTFTGNCIVPGLPTGTPCETGNSCFVNEVCVNDGFNTPQCIGTLAPGADCQNQIVGNDCIISAFCDGSDPAGPQCINQLAPNGFACTLSNPGLCAPTGQCQSGVCVPVATECPPATQECQLPFCNPSTGICGFQFEPDMSPCDDGLDCTVDDVCFGGSCSGTPRDCTPPDCQVNVGCQEPGGNCLFDPVPDGTACTDGTCAGGVCILECDPPCQNGGECIGVNPTECRCPFAFEGQFCQLESLNIMDDLDTFLTDTFADLQGILFILILAIAGFSVLIAFCCYCLRETPVISAIIPVNKQL